MSQIILPYDKEFYDEYKVFIKPVDYPLSNKKIESLLKIAEMQRYYQCNPVRFIDNFFNIELLDSQALAVQRSWFCPNVLITATRGWGKSTVIDLELMSKGMLTANYWAYIASGSGSQAEQTFTTLEKLANDNIDTFAGSTGKIFKDEVEIKNASGDGFSHGSNGFKYELYNGSFTQTLNSNVDAKRGARGSVIFDESGFLSEEMMNVYSAFAIVDKNLKTGKDASGRSIDPIRQRTFPTDVPNQKFYISSASSVDTKFYRLYKEFAMKQIEGDPDYCVLHIDCEQAFKPTIRGEVISPLLSRSQVQTEMRTNPEKARREYYCIFTTDAGTNAIIKRSEITRNEEIRKPLLKNDTGDKKFIIAYDPARSRDNSVIAVLEVYGVAQVDGSTDLRGRLVNCINLVDVGKKIKSPMRTPDQVEYLKEIILRYNGGADAYGNILGVFIDAGSGGGGVNIADYLMPDWTTPDGITHRGLIDKNYSADYVKQFPNAVDKIRLMSPTEFKSIMFNSMIEMVTQDKISFTATYDHKGYLTVFDVDEELLRSEKEKIEAELKKKKLSQIVFEERVKERLSEIQSVNTRSIKLDWEDEIALANIDAMKEEAVNMVRIKRANGKDSFELTPEKTNRLHDDRAYVLAMVGYGLAEERRKLILNKPKKTDSKSLVSQLTIRRGSYGGKTI